MAAGRAFVVLTAFLVLGALFTFSATAQEPRAGRRLALVVGIDDYKVIPRLALGRNDARTMSAALKELGFEVSEGLDLARTDMSRMIERFEASVAPGDTVFFFYAGSGAAFDNRTYLFPTDMPIPTLNDAALDATAFDVDELVERLRRNGPDATIVVIDTCRNDMAEKRTDAVRRIALVQALRPAWSKSVFLFYSAGAGQFALERLGSGDPSTNSVFTRVFAEEVRRPGVRLLDAARATRDRVRAMSDSIGRAQTPAFYDEGAGEMILKDVAR